MSNIIAIAKKELRAYFSSPSAILFIATYLGVTLFNFFTVEAFFARNIADVRPLFEPLPVFMIFLAAALTMRLWSEEQKAGTLEVLLTLPVRTHELVLGKFFGALLLVMLALTLTVGLPITTSALGALDWGPVVGGYFGAVLLAGAYISVGLFVSALTRNQIVALIVSVVVCLLLWLPGYSAFNDLFPTRSAEILRKLSTSGRFESIARGVIDLRDLAYYAALSAFFLLLNTFALEARSWSDGTRTRRKRANAKVFAMLAALNLIALNIWLSPFGSVRADLTENGIYSLSPVTKKLTRSLENPLLIRTYFSEKTHPELAPLVPQIKDMIEEYAAVSDGNVRAEFVNPQEDEDLEKEANQEYGIRSFPFQFQNMTEASVVNSYFSILVKYGDQFEVLNFGDIIEVGVSGRELQVRLKNLEYDLTRSIKKVVYGFQTLESMFAELDDDVSVTAYVTPDTLPDNFKPMAEQIASVLDEIKGQSGGRFSWKQIDPVATGGQALQRELFDKYGFRPMGVSFFSNETFYLHLLLETGDRAIPIALTEAVSEADLRKEVVATIKRSTSGFLKTVGLVKPPEPPPPQPQMPNMPPPQVPKLEVAQLVEQKLGEDYTVRTTDLSSGRVPGDVDVLMVFAPSELDDKAAFAVDQFLMRGGSVIIFSGHYELDAMARGDGISLKKTTSGLGEVLSSYGVNIEDSLVMDTQNEPFPVPVVRDLGGFKVREIQLMQYPFFVEVRDDGMAQSNPIVSGLTAVTMQWASPVEVEPVEIDGEPVDREVVPLLRSSEESWTVTDANAAPDFKAHGELGFPRPSGQTESHTLATAIVGRFPSAFKGKPSPLWAGGEAPAEGAASPGEVDSRTLTVSPDKTRLIVVGSSSFANRLVLGISSQVSGDRAGTNLQLVQNMVDWAVEDTDLLSIRTVGAFARDLKTLDAGQKKNYRRWNILVLVAVLTILELIVIRRRKNRTPMSLDPAPDAAPTSKLGTEAS